MSNLTPGLMTNSLGAVQAAFDSGSAGEKSTFQAAVSGDAPGKNLFDKTAVTVGYEMYGDGTLSPDPGSVVCAPIDVTGQTAIAISGLPNNTAFRSHYFAFYAAGGAVISVYLLKQTYGVLTVPAGAAYMRGSPAQRMYDTYNLDSVQIEYGPVVTGFVPFARTTKTISDIDASRYFSQSSAFYGKRWLVCGDSRTETAEVLDDGTYTERPEANQVNWPTFARKVTRPSSWYNYAKSGASYREYVGQSPWQSMWHQVEMAAAHKRQADIIVFDAGTNDGTAYLGDGAAQLALPIGSVDMQTTAGALRKCLHFARTNWPDAAGYLCLPTQRADFSTAARQPLFDLLTMMAGQYGFTVIDCHRQSGICRDMEIDGAEGQHLYDGLHPKHSGSGLLSRLVCNTVKATL